ncbi:hypothetical protein BH24ACI4_BH24ACI4_23650 [soil metagenome]
MCRFFVVLLMFASTGAAAGLAAGQSVTGQLVGVVTDASGARITGATVTIRNTGTATTRDLRTESDGTFLFADLLPGAYDLTITSEGFKTAEQEGITLRATERLLLPAIVLEVGGLLERVTVTREPPLVQTSSGARSALISRQQLDSIALKGRDFAGILKLLPGVVDTSPREAPGWNSMGGLSINGRSGGFNFSYDGVTNKDTGSNLGNYAAPGLDSIAEVRVQASNFQAEYGRSSGATITVVTRSGSRDFHGSAAFYKRDDAWNGNEFARMQGCGLGQKEGCRAPLYRFDNAAWTVGGPVLLPRSRFNMGRDKLFFFWSQDVLARTDPGVLNQRRMPTALERSGDFSQTFDSSGRLVFIRDPQRTGACGSTSGGPACFPGNVIPADRIDPTAQELLTLFPLPNAVDGTGANQYNYTFQTVQEWPRNDQVLRLDWNMGPRTTAYGRFQFGHEKRSGPVSFLGFTGGWPQMASKYEVDTISYVNTLLHSFSGTLFAEATAGVNWAHQHTSPLDQAAQDANDRSRVLPGFPQFFPTANPLNLLPNATFNGGIPGNVGVFQYERRFPYYGFNTLWNFSGSLTKVHGRHTLKTGIFVEHTTRPVRQRSAFNGTVSFNADGSNPLNTNIGFANALLGAITSYQEADTQPTGKGQFVNTEFYAQDTWRLSRPLTLDGGVRFYILTPTRNQGRKVAQFEPERFSDAAAPLLFAPITTAQGRRAVNPVTGEVLPLVYVGRLVPGSGDVINGMQVFPETPQGTTPLQVAPRLGFAWDVTGDGRSAIRGGVGLFYDRYSDNDILELAELPPLVRTYTTNYTTIPELLGSPLTATTSAVRRIEPFVPPVVYNWSLGGQREVGWSLVADVAYVGNAARRQMITRELNGRPYGYAYQPSSLDATNVLGGWAQPLPEDLLRPYRGYASISQREFTGYADYHSLQVALTRRHSANGLSIGAAYTHEMVNKALGSIDPFLPDSRARNYNSAGRRPHTLTIHYSYVVPNLRRASSPPLLGALLHEWQISGVTSLLSGAQDGFGYVYTDVPTGALSGNGSINGGASRPRIVCDPILPRGERTFERQFRTECIAAPADAFHFGTARGDEFHGPGFVNWDISVFKGVPLGSGRRLQLRAELYNAFNTSQWTTVNTTARFDYTTGALTNPMVFGALTGATHSARRVQLAARFTF